jgi:4-hydroxybenzoate polyprenyltransferase
MAAVTTLGLPVLVRACHPAPTVAVTGVATALATSTGLGARSARVGAAVLTGQLAIGWTNDWLDAGRDRQVGRPDKPLVSGEVRAHIVGAAALAAAAGCVPASFSTGRAAGATHLAAVGSGLAYDLGLKATPASVLPYAASFGLLPSVVTRALPGAPWASRWASAAGALLGVAGHFANTLPDLGEDERTGVRGLPHRLGGRGSRVVASSALVAAAGVLAYGPTGRLDRLGLAGLGVAAVGSGAVARSRRTGSRAAFAAVLATAAVDVGLLLARGPELAPSAAGQ